MLADDADRQQVARLRVGDGRGGSKGRNRCRAFSLLKQLLPTALRMDKYESLSDLPQALARRYHTSETQICMKARSFKPMCTQDYHQVPGKTLDPAACHGTGLQELCLRNCHASKSLQDFN